MHPNAPHYVMEISAKTLMTIVIMVFIAIVFFFGGYIFGAKYSQKPQGSTIAPTITGSPGETGVPQISEVPPTVVPSVSATPETSCQQDSDCTLYDTNKTTTTALCCNISCSNYYDTSVIAVNTTWFTNYKANTCNKRTLCPMIAMQCTQEAMQSHNSVKAACQNNVCVKVTQ